MGFDRLRGFTVTSEGQPSLFILCWFDYLRGFIVVANGQPLLRSV